MDIERARREHHQEIMIDRYESFPYFFDRCKELEQKVATLRDLLLRAGRCIVMDGTPEHRDALRREIDEALR